MNKVERQVKILNELKSKGSVNINDLHQKYDVSKVTIRTDIDEMDKKGYLKKTRGGGILSENRSLYRLVENTVQEKELEKDQIARAAAKLVKPGMVIIIDAGSTTSFLPRYIKTLNLTVITNSLLVVHDLSGLNNISLIVSGGNLRNESQSLIGIPSLAFFDTVNADILFLGSTGYSIERGVSTSDAIEAETKKKMIASSSEVFLLMDSSKIGNDSLTKVCSSTELSGIVTDKLSAKQKQQLEDLDLNFIEAGSEESDIQNDPS